MVTTLTNMWHTIWATIQTIGPWTFLVFVIINIVLYKIHPVLGLLGTLFLFAHLLGFI